MASMNSRAADNVNSNAAKMLSELESAPVALMIVKQSYVPSFSCQSFAIVEGADDEIFYSGYIKTILGLEDLTVVRAGSKRSVLETYDKIDWNVFERERVLFFIDRDHDELIVDSPYPVAKNLYITDCYAIENYICTCKCFMGICSTACGNAESALAAIDKQEVERIYCDAFDKFERAISKIPEMSIAWRRYGLKPNMRNINLKQLLTIENGNVNVKCTEVLATMKRQVGISCESPTISDSEIEDIGRSLEAYGDFVARTNGKLIFDFFQMLLGSMQHYEFPSGAKITRNQLLTSNVLSTGIAIQGCPDSLRSFLMALRK